MRYAVCCEQTDAAAKAYRVYHSKTGDDKDYLVDHSIIMYLLNPEGDFVTFYGKNFEAPALAESIKGHMLAWQKSHPGTASKPAPA
jgi:protein SCO1/2